MSDHGAHDSHGGKGKSGLSIKLPWKFIVPLVVFMVPVLIYFAPSVAAFILSAIAFLAPVWLPALLVWIGWPLWLTFVRSHYVYSIPYTTIELIPGADTPRSARAMELVFYALHHRTEVTRVSEYLLGQVRMPWSFEIWAHAGAVRFFVHVPAAHREAMDARIRAEYRDITVKSSEDYARTIDFSPERNTLSMREFTLIKPDPYPLKTYAAFEQELGKRDVFAELLESMVTVGEKEHLLVSFIVRPHQREREGLEDESVDSLHRDAQHEIVSLLGHNGDLHAASPGTRKVIGAIEAALKKPSFDCGARALFIGERGAGENNATERLEHLLDGFNDPELNGFKPYDPHERTGWLLKEFSIVAPTFKDLYALNLYRRRAFFAPPYYGERFILNTEELATLFHIPRYARASALSGIHGVRLEPPANLPT